jgi:hypothetical protein
MKIVHQNLNLTQFERKFNVREIDKRAPNGQRQTTTLYCEMSTMWETRKWQYIKRL